MFDLDDTLHDRAAAIPTFVTSQACRLLEMQVPDAMRFAQRFVELEERGRVWKDRVYGELSREFPQARHADERLLNDYLRSFPKSCRLRQGAEELLRQLRGKAVRLGIITNGRSDMQLAVVSALGLGDLVDSVVISERVGLRKPDPRIFHHALAEVGAEARSSVFVGDDVRSDVEGALSAGFRHAYWFDTAAVAESAVPSRTSRVTSFAELTEKLVSF
ncbi:HAD family hydrolase [Bradyrhizobium sp. B117]|uniref:HAD family hydrolase n=1 Tax=Bradyrhizobium sp. B117 TaxID=3140246 RepID=UPI0031840032